MNATRSAATVISALTFMLGAGCASTSDSFDGRMLNLTHDFLPWDFNQFIHSNVATLNPDTEVTLLHQVATLPGDLILLETKVPAANFVAYVTIDGKKVPMTLLTGVDGTGVWGTYVRGPCKGTRKYYFGAEHRTAAAGSRRFAQLGSDEKPFVVRVREFGKLSWNIQGFAPTTQDGTVPLSENPSSDSYYVFIRNNTEYQQRLELAFAPEVTTEQRSVFSFSIPAFPLLASCHDVLRFKVGLNPARPTPLGSVSAPLQVKVSELRPTGWTDQTIAFNINIQYSPNDE